MVQTDYEEWTATCESKTYKCHQNVGEEMDCLEAVEYARRMEEMRKQEEPDRVTRLARNRRLRAEQHKRQEEKQNESYN